MNSLQIKTASTALPFRTKGVYAADLIPKHWEVPAALVFNTDVHTKPGLHWVSIFVDSRRRGFYFDSFGLPPFIKQHADRIKSNCKIYRWNNKQFQHNDSSTCGAFSILFLHIMSSGFNFDRFSRLFTTNLYKNDQLVRQYYNEYRRRFKHQIKNVKYIKCNQYSCSRK